MEKSKMEKGEMIDMFLWLVAALLMACLMFPGCSIWADWTTHYRGVEIHGDDCDREEKFYVDEAKLGIDDALDYFGLETFSQSIGFHDTSDMRWFCETTTYGQIPYFCHRAPNSHGLQGLILCDATVHFPIYEFRDMVATITARHILWIQAGKPRDGFPYHAICLNELVFYDLNLECVFDDPAFMAEKCGKERAAACGY